MPRRGGRMWQHWRGRQWRGWTITHLVGGFTMTYHYLPMKTVFVMFVYMLPRGYVGYVIMTM